MPFPAPEEAIARAERLLGTRFPEAWRARLVAENGGEVDLDEAWFLFPVLDSTDRKRLARSCNDVVSETQKARERRGFPSDGVAVGDDGAGNYLVLLPGECDAGALGARLYRWDHESAEVDPLGSSLAAILAGEGSAAEHTDVEPNPVHREPGLRLETSKTVPEVLGLLVGVVPRPWRLLTPRAETDVVWRVQLGRKGACWLDVVDGPIPGAGSEESWKSLWCELTGLPRSRARLVVQYSEARVGRVVVPFALVRSRGWTPVLGWLRVEARNWHFRFRSELPRVESDLRELERLWPSFDLQPAAP